MIKAIATELVLREQYIKEKIHTLYFGGGTPSLLHKSELELLINTVYKTFPFFENPEITIETNPDDITHDTVSFWKDLGINRLSIGIQSFNDEVLKFLNRVHNSGQAIKSIELGQKFFSNNLNIDLIYAIPKENHDIWQDDLTKAVEFKPKHISAYNLTVEEKTVFGNWVKKGRINEVDEDFATEQYILLIQKLRNAGYDHYEVSNFCLPGGYSQHNTSYWKRKEYLGVGPGAHSFNNFSRSYNISSNPLYIKEIKEGNVPSETEILSAEQKLNEYLLTGLRTKWGVDLKRLEEEFHYDIYHKKSFIGYLIEKSLAKMTENNLILTEEGFLLADEIVLKLST